MRKRIKKNTFPLHTLVYVFLCIFILLTHKSLAADDLTDKLDKIKKEIKKTEKLQNVKQNQATIIQRQIENITKEARSLEEKIKKEEKELRQLNDAIERTRMSIIEQEKTIAAQKKILSHLIRKQYETRARSPIVHFLLPHALTFTANDYITQTQKKIHGTIAHITKLRAKMEKDRRTLERKKNELEETKKKLEKRNEYLESAYSYKKYLMNRTKREISAYANKINKLEQEEEAIRREIERIEAGKIDSVNFANLPSKKKADFDYPVKKVIITQYYGRTKFSARAYRSGFHNGVDFGGGGDILAAGDGKVIATGNMGRYGYGKWVAIDHKNGLVTLYGHMSKIKVRKGEKVDKGDKIGVMGTTGYSTGVHLHFSVFAASTFEVVNSSRVSGIKVPTGASVNPMLYL